ncbi:MAG: glycosyltransferase [Methylophilaceae bacterium]
MSRIVFAWELGSNYGYISQFLPFARELKLRGHEVVLVVRELHHAQRMMTEGDIPILQAPMWLPTVQGLPEPPLNYAEILLRFGYHDAQSLAGVVSAWRTLLMLYQADVLIASHAPTALLAARSMGLPAAGLGTGFSIPPRVSPTPNMRYWVNVSPERLNSGDAAVLSTMNTLLTACGKPAMASVSELFDVQEQFLCTLPELDHYPKRANARYWGAVYDTQMGQEAAWKALDAKRVLVYLEPSHRDFAALLEALKNSGVQALICAPGISSNLIKANETEKVRIYNQPIKFLGLLETCDLAICHAGHGTTAGMLMAGVPLLMFPNHLEQFLLAKSVQDMGAGLLVNLEAAAPELPPVLQRMLQTPEFKLKAQQFASNHAEFTQATLISSITARIEEIAAK